MMFTKLDERLDVCDPFEIEPKKTYCKMAVHWRVNDLRENDVCCCCDKALVKNLNPVNPTINLPSRPLSPWVPIYKRVTLRSCLPSEEEQMVEFKIKTEADEEDPKKKMEREDLCRQLSASKEITDRLRKRYQRFFLGNNEKKEQGKDEAYTYRLDEDSSNLQCKLSEGTFLTGGRTFDRSVNPRVSHKYQNPEKFDCKVRFNV